MLSALPGPGRRDEARPVAGSSGAGRGSAAGPRRAPRTSSRDGPLDGRRGGEQLPRVYWCCGSSSTSSVGPCSTISPWYITATVSAMFHASPRSWVMTSALSPSRSRSDSSRARISPRAEASSEATGSSATSSCGPTASAPAIDGALALPARQLLRDRGEEVLRRGELGVDQALRHALLLVAAVVLHPQPLGHRLVHAELGVQRGRGILQHHLHLLAERLQPSALAWQIGSPEADDRSGVGLLQPDEGAGERRLARARLAHERHDLAATHLQVDRLHRVGRLGAAW